MTIPTQERTTKLYHADPGSAFSVSIAVGIVLAALGTWFCVGVIMGSFGAPVLAVATAGQLALLVIPGGLLVMAQRGPRALGFRGAPWPAFFAAALIGCSAWLLNLQLVRLFPITEHTHGALVHAVIQPPLVLTLLVVAVLPAICEEVLFRGVLVRGLATRFSGPIAVIASSIVFGLYHLSIVQFFSTFTLGLALGALTLRSGSIIPGMITHLLNNAAAVIVSRGELPALSTWIDSNVTLALVSATTATSVGLAILIGTRAPRL
ncbi:MAG: CPBP family glutamic-type intramembrane protease [Kofleriaceae bacterium]